MSTVIEGRTTGTCDDAVEVFMERVVAQAPGETVFHQAVRETVRSVMPVVMENKAYQDARILDRMVVPDRVILFRVTWVDDQGQVQVNRGYRVQMNAAIGPYMRVSPKV